MIADEINAALEALADQIVSDAAKFAAKELRRRCPPERERTLRSIYSRSQGSVAIVGLRFAVRYTSANTQTGRWIEREWNRIRPQVRRRMKLAFEAGLQEFFEN